MHSLFHTLFPAGRGERQRTTHHFSETLIAARAVSEFGALRSGLSCSLSCLHPSLPSPCVVTPVSVRVKQYMCVYIYIYIYIYIYNINRCIPYKRSLFGFHRDGTYSSSSRSSIWLILFRLSRSSLALYLLTSIPTWMSSTSWFLCRSPLVHPATGQPTLRRPAPLRS